MTDEMKAQADAYAAYRRAWLNEVVRRLYPT